MEMGLEEDGGGWMEGVKEEGQDERKTGGEKMEEYG